MTHLFQPITLKYHKACINDKQNSQNIEIISPKILNFNKNILKLPMIQLSAGRPSAQTHHPLVF